MTDLKTLTVRYLRELARKHLGKGHSRLKTKEELIDALREFLPSTVKIASVIGAATVVEKATPSKPRAPALTVVPPPAPAPTAPKIQAVMVDPVVVTAPAKPAAPKPEPEKSAAPKPTPVKPAPAPEPQKAAAAKAEPEKRAAPKPEPVKPAPAPEPQKAAVARAEPVKPPPAEPVARPSAAPEARPAVVRPAEPLIEGFFVARVAGSDEARRHHMTEDANRHAVETRSKITYEEAFGDLPSGYQDDEVVALPRDPDTVYFYWDLDPVARQRALDELGDGRALMRIFDGTALVRELDFALEARGFYVTGLTPLRRYRIEVHLIGRDGQTRLLGRPSNLFTVPREGPSPETAVTFLKAPWQLPVTEMVESIQSGAAQVTEAPGEHEYLEVPEVVDRGGSASMPARRPGEGPSRGPGGRPTRDRYLGASERHQGASWPSGRR